jgi:hypothetical protein
LLGIPQEDSLIGKFLRKCHPGIYRRSEHIHYYSEPSMRTLLKSAGFFIDRVAPFGMLFPNYYVHYVLLGIRPVFALGHRLAQGRHALADSLIFVVRKPASPLWGQPQMDRKRRSLLQAGGGLKAP